MSVYDQWNVRFESWIVSNKVFYFPVSNYIVVYTWYVNKFIFFINATEQDNMLISFLNWLTLEIFILFYLFLCNSVTQIYSYLLSLLLLVEIALFALLYKLVGGPPLRGGDFAEICTRDSIQGEKNNVWRIIGKFKFLQKREIPKVCTFCNFSPKFDPLFLPEDSGNRKKLNIFKEKTSYRAIQISQNLSPISLNFSGKIQLLFALFRVFFAKKGAWSHIEGPESKFDTIYFTKTISGHIPVKKFWSQHFPILRLYVPKVVFYIFQPTFSRLAAILDTTPLFLIKISLIFQCRIYFCISWHQFQI